MTTEWVVSAGTERVELTTSGTEAKPGPSIGEITFTVTNPGPVEDRAVFEIVPGDGAKKSWFTVDEPQRTVPAGQSVTYLVRMLVPVGEPAGPFWAQGRVYSADTAPEESSRLSGRFTGEVGATQKVRSRLWLVLAIAGLAIVVGGVVAWLLLRPDNEPDPQPSPSPTVDQAVVPNVQGSTEKEANAALAKAGLELGAIKHRSQLTGKGTIVSQSVPPESKVEPGSNVDVEIAVTLGAPTPQVPQNGWVSPDRTTPTLTWSGVDDATAYHVRRERWFCSSSSHASCRWVSISSNKVTGATSWKPSSLIRSKLGKDFSTGTVKWRWQVTALDDFNSPGATSAFSYYQIPRN